MDLCLTDKESEFGEDKVDTRKRGTELGPQTEHTAPSLVEGDGESFTDSFSSKLKQGGQTLRHVLLIKVNPLQ